MADEKYIKQSDAKALFCKCCESGSKVKCWLCKKKHPMDAIPAADVRHVVHAQWEDVEVERVEDMENPPDVIAAMFCPNCKRWHNEVYFYGNPTENVHFCSFCGADMREPAVS